MPPALTPLSRAASWALGRLEPLLGSLTDRLVHLAGSRSEDASIGTAREAAQFVVLPSGLDLAPFFSAARARGRLRRELRLAPDVPLAGTAAPRQPAQGHESLFSVARAVLRRLPRAHFVVAGDGDARTELERLARLWSVSDRVHFIGDRLELAAVYADLDAALLCCAEERSPLLALGAMACGKPVAAVRAGVLAELIEHGRQGLLAPPGSSADLAGALLTLLGNPFLAQELGRRGAETARDYDAALLSQGMIGLRTALRP